MAARKHASKHAGKQRQGTGCAHASTQAATQASTHASTQAQAWPHARSDLDQTHPGSLKLSGDRLTERRTDKQTDTFTIQTNVNHISSADMNTIAAYTHNNKHVSHKHVNCDGNSQH